MPRDNFEALKRKLADLREKCKNDASGFRSNSAKKFFTQVGKLLLSSRATASPVVTAVKPPEPSFSSSSFEPSLSTSRSTSPSPSRSAATAPLVSDYSLDGVVGACEYKLFNGGSLIFV